MAPAEPGSRVETSYGFSANGARALQNNFQLDGIDNNANLGDVLNGSAYVVQPSVDAIAEFKVETNSYSGHPDGAQWRDHECGHHVWYKSVSRRCIRISFATTNLTLLTPSIFSAKQPLC